MGVLHRGLLLHPAIAADRRINETSTNGSKDQTEYDCGNRAGGGEIVAADQLRVNKDQTSSKKGESKEGQKNGSAFGRLGHPISLGAFEGTKHGGEAELPLRLYLNLGTGMAVARHGLQMGMSERAAISSEGRR